MPPKAHLTEGHVGRQLIRLVLPMVVGMLSMVLFNMADTYYVGKLGTQPLAAMSFTFPVVMLIGAFSIGLGAGASSVVSRAIGEGDHHKVQRLATHALILAVGMVAVLAVIGYLTIDPVFRLLGADAETLPMIRQYMTIWYCGVVFVVVPMVGNNCIRASGDTVTAAGIMVAAAGLNVLLDPIFIFGRYGFPEMGIAGAALATVISRACTLVLSLAVLHYRKRMLDWSRPKLAEVLSSWRAVLYIAGPSGLTTVLFPLSMAWITRLVSGHGEEAVAAMGAGQRVEAFVMMVIWATAGVLTPYVGQNTGAGQFHRVRRAVLSAGGFSLVWGILCLGVFAALARPIAGLFTSSEIVERIMTRYLWIIAMGLGFRGVCVLACSYFNGTNRPLHAGGMDIIRMFLLYMPLAALGDWQVGLYGVFIGITASNFIAGTIAAFWINAVTGRDEQGMAEADEPEPAADVESG